MSGRRKPPVGVRAKEWERRSDSASRRRRSPPADDATEELDEIESGDDDAA